MLALNGKELAKELSVGEGLIKKLRDQGAIPAIKHGKGYIYPVKGVEKFLDQFNGLDISNEQAIEDSMKVIERKQRYGNI